MVLNVAQTFDYLGLRLRRSELADNIVNLRVLFLQILLLHDIGPGLYCKFALFLDRNASPLLDTAFTRPLTYNLLRVFAPLSSNLYIL